jgi:predicted  nucleic acid-binding Zn-ribbon protein
MNPTPYHKDKQQAYQAAQQGMKQTKDAYRDLQIDGENCGEQLKQLRQEINETTQQIENAMEVASETQRIQLETFRSDIEQIVHEVKELSDQT